MSAVEEEIPTAVEQSSQSPGAAEEQPKKEEAPAKKPRKPRATSHPPYFQMIKEALVALNEKSGSSPYAIAKYMEEKHKSVLPRNFRKILGLQVKNCVANGKLIKIKASYKLAESGKKEKKAKSAAGKAKPVAKKAKSAAGKAKAAETVPKKKVVSTPKKAKAGGAAAAKKKVVSTPKKSKKAAKAKQPKSIKSPAAKRAKRASAA